MLMVLRLLSTTLLQKDCIGIKTVVDVIFLIAAAISHDIDIRTPSTESSWFLDTLLQLSMRILILKESLWTDHHSLGKWLLRGLVLVVLMIV